MRLSLAAAGALWAIVAYAHTVHAQVLPTTGPGSSTPVGPDDRPLVSRPVDYPFRTIGLTAGMPGPVMPNPNDPTRVLGRPGELGAVQEQAFRPE